MLWNDNYFFLQDIIGHSDMVITFYSDLIVLVAIEQIVFGLNLLRLKEGRICGRKC